MYVNMLYYLVFEINKVFIFNMFFIIVIVLGSEFF